MAAYLYSDDENPLRMVVAVDLADAVRLADFLRLYCEPLEPSESSSDEQTNAALRDFTGTTYEALWAVKEVADEVLTVRPPERSPFDAPPEWDTSPFTAEVP